MVSVIEGNLKMGTNYKVQPMQFSHKQSNPSVYSSFCVEWLCALLHLCTVSFARCHRVGNSKKTFKIINVTSTRTVCKDVPVEEAKCSFSWSSSCLTDFSKCFTW